MAFVAAVLVMVLIVVLVTPFARKIATPPGHTLTPPARRAGGVAVAATCALASLAVLWMSWADAHHHAALRVIVLAGVCFAANAALLGAGYRRHNRGAREDADPRR